MILITAPIHPSFTDALNKQGLRYRLVPDIRYDELITIISEATGLVVSNRINIDSKMISAAQQLQWIGRLGSGMEHIDVAFAAEKGIRCISSPEGNRRAVAEHALGLLLNLLRHIKKSNSEIQHFQWKRNENTGREIASLHIGIIGYGNTGGSFATILSQLGAKVFALDKYKSGFGTDNIIEADLKTIVEHCDVISFHLPLGASTHHYANDSFFASLKKKPLIINTSRGSVVNSAALLKALDYKMITGAALDVLENEQLSTYNNDEKLLLKQLTEHPMVLLTPHIAGYTYEAFFRMSQVLLEKLGLAD